MEPLTQAEVLERLAEIEPGGEEYKALCWMRDVFYMAAEGFISLEAGRVYPIDA